MLDLICIFPNLNEKIDVVEANLLKCFHYCKSKGFKAKIVLSDGGSSLQSISSLKNFVEKIGDRNVSVQLLLCLPAMRPNKNLGILNVIERYKSKNVLILDSDLLSLDEKCLDSLVIPLISNEAKMVLPNIRRISGRSNKLVINPLLRLFRPAIARKANFVLSGILGIGYGLLRKIVISPDYCWDWGGEIQIICRGFSFSGNRVKTFLHERKDAKRRGLESKMKEARQIFRTLLYEITKTDNLEAGTVEENLVLDWKRNKSLVRKFQQWQKQNRIIVVPSVKDLKAYFHGFLSKCELDLNWFSLYLDEIYNKTGAREILILKSIASDTVLKTLFGIDTKCVPEEINPEEISKVNFDNISVLADVIFAVYISIWLKKRRNKRSSFDGFLALLSPSDTDFTNVEILNNFRRRGLCSVDTSSIKTRNSLKEIIRVYNDENKDLSKRNELLVKMMKIYGRNRNYQGK